MKNLFVAALLAGMGLGLLVQPAPARPRKEVLSITTHTSTSTVWKAATNYAVAGWLESIMIDVPAGAQTADVAVVALPAASTESADTLITNADLTDDITYRPRWPASTAGGSAALTQYDGLRFCVFGEPIQFSVGNAQDTNETWRCIIKFDDGRP